MRHGGSFPELGDRSAREMRMERRLGAACPNDLVAINVVVNAKVELQVRPP